MHLLKFKKTNRKENNEDEASKVHVDNSTLDVENTDNQPQRSSEVEKEIKKETTESPEVNETYQEKELNIPSRQELLPVFEELVAYIYQLEFDRNVKDDVKIDRQKD
jgi:phenylalanyl-tRNA synthetase alpha subunit